MEDLIEALAKANIEKVSPSNFSSENASDSNLKNDVNLSNFTIQQTSNDEYDVDVYIAPEVLGHRWVRSRSTAYIVERPERLRASLLGLSAIIGKSFELLTSTEPIKKEYQYNDLRDELASLSIAKSSEHGKPCIQALISRAKVSLATPNKGLSLIHGSEEARVSLDELAIAPAYFTASQSELPLTQQDWPRSELSYLAYLQMLCQMAPDREPKAVETSHFTRQNNANSPHKSTLPVGKDSKQSVVPLSDGSFPSEIPFNLPQGDLYLCGDQSLQNSPEQLMEDLGPQTPQQENKPFIDFEARNPVVKSDRERTVEFTNDSKPWTGINLFTEAELIRRGSKGAIEASLGACCIALDRIVQRSLGLTGKVANPEVSSVDLSGLNSAKSPQKDDAPRSTGKKAFVLARPPGHHCSSKAPSGFCWVNNVAVVAAEAYAKYRIDRIAILDFDLHHGDGTQSIIWKINEETNRLDADREAKKNAILADEKNREKKHKSGTSNTKRQYEKPRNEPEENVIPNISFEPIKPVDIDRSEGQEDQYASLLGRRGLKVFYGSLHDIESFPCEDGNQQKVTDASVRLEGGHGQWIWNVHLEGHGNRDEFLLTYENKYKELIRKAQQFFEKTQSTPGASMVILSAGFDACIHETPGMQRHGKNVPTEFYTLFTRDSVQLANEFCNGKLMSVLEGGYSDRALTSGVIAHIAGMTDRLGKDVGEELCSPTTLSQLDRLSKLSANSMTTNSKDVPLHESFTTRKRSEWSSKDPQWLKYTFESFKRLQEYCGKQRKKETNGSATAPATPKNDESLLSSWHSPRETRSSRNAASAKPSPMK